jgi:glycosyltransferase involved in cell wall biosynthesis
VGGCPELLEEGQAGVLTKDFTADSVAFAIESVIRDGRLRKRLEARAVKKAQSLSLSASADHLTALYDHVLREKNIERGLS